MCVCMDILAGCHNLKGLFEGKDMVLRFRLGLGLGSWAGWQILLIKSPHKDRRPMICLFVCYQNIAHEQKVGDLHTELSASCRSCSMNLLRMSELIFSFLLNHLLSEFDIRICC